jgi:ParB-like chromosome segregation protein Spo0J
VNERPRLTAGGEYLVVTVPLRITRRGGRKQVIAPADLNADGSVQRQTNQPLALALARAHRWRQLLEEGRHATIRELALAVGVDNSYVARLLRLTLLAPDIVEAIIEGTEPDGLSLAKLYGMPPAWENQRRLLDGVSADSSDGGQ